MLTPDLSANKQEQKKRLLKAKIAVALHDELGGIRLRWDSWNMTAVTSKMHGMPVTGGRGFRALKPLWYNGVPP